MALPQEVETELRQLLRAFRNNYPGARDALNQGKALEAWVLLKLADAARALMPHWTVTLRQGNGSLLTAGQKFQLSSKPTGISGKYCFVLLECKIAGGCRVEMHNSLQWLGRSNARHEVDISVVPTVIAAALRGNGGGYPRGLPLVAIECKDKADIGNLDETRQTLARMYDLALVTQSLT